MVFRRTPWLASCIAAVLFVAAIAPVPALADDRRVDVVSVARKFVKELRYEEASQELDRVLRMGRATAQQLSELYLLRALVASVEGDAETTEQAFVALLSVNPSFVLAPGYSEKITDPLQKARARAGIDATYEVGKRTLSVQITKDAAGLVAGARMTVRDGTGSRVQTIAGRVSLVLPLPTSEGSVTVDLVDEFGNQVHTLIGVDHPEFEATVADTHQTTADRGIWRNPFLWGTATLISLAVGTSSALLSRSSQERYDDLLAAGEVDYSQLSKESDKGRRYATFANVAFVGSGALMVIGTILLLTGSDAPPSRTSLSPALSPDYAGARVTLRF